MVDPADAEPVENIRHQLLKAHVLHAGNALGAAEIAVDGVSARLSLAGVVDEKLGNFTERAALLAVVNDNPDPAPLGGLDADSDPVNEIRAACANVRAEYIRTVALVMDAAGDHRARLRKTLDLAKEIYRRATDRRQQDLKVGTRDQLGKHAACLLEQGTAEIRSGKPRRGDGDCRPHVDTSADMFGEDLADEMTPWINRHDFFRLGPLGMRRDPRRRRGVGQIGAMVSR